MVWLKSWRFSLKARVRRGLIGSGMVAVLASATAAPLHDAVHSDDAEKALALLAGDADPNAKNRYGVTPLSLACANGNVEIVNGLLAAGADPNDALSGGETPLMTAARTGRPEPVAALLKAGADVNAADDGQTALMWAAAEGHAAVVRQLLAAGAKRDAKLGSGFNAWFFAAREGRAEVIDVLIEAGMELNAPMGTDNTNWGRSPTRGTTALILAVENGHFDLATKLLEAGADANDQRSGYTPLHVMTWVRKPKRGDNIDGAPPPRESGSVSSLQMVDVLIEHGADVNTPLERGPNSGNRIGRPGATPFLFAARTCDVPLMKLLVERGADFRRPNKQGRTPLLAAAGVALGPEMDEAADEASALVAVDYLLELGADINAIDREGETVMHSAAYKQAPKLVKLLDKRGADIAVWNTKNRRGWTPLLIAQGFRNGNYKPSAPTIAALSEVMLAHGITPPPSPPPPGTKKKEKYGS